MKHNVGARRPCVLQKPPAFAVGSITNLRIIGASKRSVGQDNLRRGRVAAAELAIVKQIIDHHKGKIQVERAPGAGTQFTIALPRTLPG